MHFQCCSKTWHGRCSVQNHGGVALVSAVWYNCSVWVSVSVLCWGQKLATFVINHYNKMTIFNKTHLLMLLRVFLFHLWQWSSKGFLPGCQDWPWSLCLFAAPLKYHYQAECMGLWVLCKLHISRLQVRQFRYKHYLFYGLPMFMTRCDKGKIILWPLSLHALL